MKTSQLYLLLVGVIAAPHLPLSWAIFMAAVCFVLQILFGLIGD